MWSDEFVGSRLLARETVVFLVTSMLIVNGSRLFLVELGLVNERSLRILFRSVTASIERMSYEGFAMYNAWNRGSRDCLDGELHFGQCR